MAELFDKLDKLTTSLGRALEERAGGGFGALVEQPQRQARDWTSMLGGGNGVAFGSLVGQPQQGPGWADMALGAPGGFSWSSASAGYGQRGPFDLGGFEELDTLRNKRKAEEEAKARATGQRGQGQAVGERIPGGTGAAGASAWLATQRADSPVVAIADELAAYAASQGVDPALIFGILRKESQYGADGALGIRSNNPGNIMADGADPASGKIILRNYPTLLDGTKAIVDLFARYPSTWASYLGKDSLTLEDMVAIYYVGPEAYKQWGLEANDAGGSGPGGNGTVRQYLEQHIYPVARSYNQRPGAQRPTGGQAPVNVEGTAFPVQGYRGGVELHWGEDIGAADIFAAAGTPVAAMRGGKVVSAGWSDIGGWNVTLYDPESGLSFYYAHLAYQPTVQAGQTVAAGTIFGAVGDTGNAKGTGAHLHLGIGYGIHSGTGPKGGSGINFNATEYLRRVLGMPVSGAGGGGTFTP